MSELKDIVPPLELCKRIPAGEFEDSVLVWRERIGNISRDDRVKIREPEDISYKVESAEVNYFPAPTLAEILDELGNKTVCLYDGIHYEVSVCIRECDSGTKEHQWRQYGEADRNPAAAALRLWLAMREEEEQP